MGPVHPFLSPSLSPFPAPWVSLTWSLYPNFLCSCSAPRGRVPSVISSSCPAWEVTGVSLCCISLLETIITTAPHIQNGGHRWHLLLGSVSTLEQQVCSCVICQRKERGSVYWPLPLGRALSEAWMPSPAGEGRGERLSGKGRRRETLLSGGIRRAGPSPGPG